MGGLITEIASHAVQKFRLQCLTRLVAPFIQQTAHPLSPLTSACLAISCVYCGRSSKRSIMVAMVIVSGTDTPAVSSRFCKIRSVRAGLMFIMDGLAHTPMSSEGSDWLKMSMTSSADSCGEGIKLFVCVFFVIFI